MPVNPALGRWRITGSRPSSATSKFKARLMKMRGDRKWSNILDTVFGYSDLRVLGQKVEMSLVLLWSEARNTKGTVALGLVSCYLSSSFTNPLSTCEDVTKMKYMDISWGDQ